MNKIIIETKRTIIRRYEPTDIPEAFHTFGEPEGAKYISHNGLDKSIADTEKRIHRYLTHYEKYSYGLWAVIEKASQSVIGVCGLFHARESIPNMELGYRFRKSHWNKGFATESAQACLNYGFGVLNGKKIDAIVNPQHQASIKVLEKIGMSFEKDFELDSEKLKLFSISQTSTGIS
ncbi:MAG: GNAT family N-acetyltransferase [Oligoflexia bacterium]|nr:GNAT family N-acetyltransferase [Oligoflexia bacterium]